MPDLFFLSVALFGALIGATITWLVMRMKQVAQQACLTERLAQQELRYQEQLAIFQDAEDKLSDSFKALSAEALKTNSEQFTRQFGDTARALLEQLGGSSKAQVDTGHKLLETIGRSIADKIIEVDRSVKEIHKNRISTDAQLQKQLESISSTSERVGSETAKLHNILTNSRVQGVWGQNELRSVVENAGMLEHSDFFEQETVSGLDGQYRPDLRVRLPNGFNVIIDAKAPMQAYYDAATATDAQLRKSKLKEHAAAVKAHIREMARRNYPAIAAFAPALEYTVIFLPSESLFFGALEGGDDLLRFAEQHKVVITTPLSLMAFLRAVACGWTQVAVQENAQEIQRLGQELHKRIGRFMAGFARVGRGLDTVVKSYNDTVGMRRNLDSSLNRFQELGAGDGSLLEAGADIPSDVRIFEVEEESLRELLGP